MTTFRSVLSVTIGSYLTLKRFADATTRTHAAGRTYSWTPTLSWSPGDAIDVRITGSGVTATLEPFRTPEDRGGSLSYRFDLKLSERVWVPFADMRDHAFDVTNGTIVKAMRVDRKSRYHKGRRRTFSDHWRMTVESTAADADVSVSLPRKACSERGAVCSRNGTPLVTGATLDLTPPMHPSVSIADATGKEDDGYIWFDITLSNPTDYYVEVYFKTTDEGTATLGTDYRKVAGWFVFVPGETTKKMKVSLIDDEVDDDGETVVAQITEAQLVDPYSDLEYERLLILDDDKATGTINNADALPRALLARFGRTAAVHVVEHVEERMQAPREPGFRGRFAGRELQRGAASRCRIGERDAVGGLRHGGRQRARGRRLHGGERDAEVRGRRAVEDDRGGGARRRARRGRGDADTDTVERLVGAGDRRRGDGDDQEPRSDAAGSLGAVRAGGGGAGGRIRLPGAGLIFSSGNGAEMDRAAGEVAA